ncbi:phage terminase small subunit P27 family [Listeria sp. FSL L7-1582]|uniref:phage terminase small subunit P27 family n=1 Tax=Listeria portnoyi TaxID=2713504 RepID=UPI00164E0812|nr:phage terminase small subunit P27 family [Listeria portnoyi]MBC6310140.1 phage terminase small subunit P27 family [Listeria portnoyi]
MSNKKMKLVDTAKGHLTTIEKSKRKRAENMASDGFANLQKSAPNHLGSKARYEYERISKELQKLPVRSLDKATVELYCVWYGIYREAYEEVKENGIYTVMSEITEEGIVHYKDRTRKNPAITVMNDATSNIRSLASSLGLTVDSRLKLMIPKVEEREKSLKDIFG